MKKSLENSLYAEFPEIFRQKDLPMHQSAMCWGISTGDGWFNLIRELCVKLDKNNQARKERGQPVIEATQVKEKFGGLRFYATNLDEHASVAIQEAEEESIRICEVCGEPGKPGGRGWIKTLCEKHRKDENA